MPEMILKQPGLTHSGCGSFTLNKKIIRKYKETEKFREIFFQHDMAYGDFIDYVRRRVSDKVFTDKAFNIAKNPKYDGYQRGLASMVFKLLYRKSAWLADKSAKGGIDIL